MTMRMDQKRCRTGVFVSSGLSALLVGALALATASCGQDADTRGATESRAVEVADSGAVMTVELGRVENLSAPQLTPTLLQSTRQRGIELFRVTAAVLLDGGGVALANSGTREVLLLADDGSVDRRAGGHGEGPGEFEEITSMVRSSDGLLVYDARMGRMNEFTESGDFVTSWSFKWRSRFLDLKLPPEFVAAVEKVPHNETFPAFETAILGPGEMVWIGLHARPGDETRTWLVIGPDGQAKGRMELPAAAWVLAVGADRFALVQRDELEVEDVRVYAL